jgi:hypothetical protein
VTTAGVFGLGVLIGAIFATVLIRFRAVGKLHVETSDPTEQPYLFLELSRSVGSVLNKRYVMLKVDAKNYFSRE